MSTPVHDSQIVLAARVPLFSRPPKPPDGFTMIPWHAAPLHEHEPKGVLRVRVSSLCRDSEQSNGFGVVLWHAEPVPVEHPKIALAGRVPLLRGEAELPRGFAVVPRHAVTMRIQKAEIVLRVGISSCRCDTNPLDGFFPVWQPAARVGRQSLLQGARRIGPEVVRGLRCSTRGPARVSRRVVRDPGVDCPQVGPEFSDAAIDVAEACVGRAGAKTQGDHDRSDAEKEREPFGQHASSIHRTRWTCATLTTTALRPGRRSRWRARAISPPRMQI